MKWRPGFSHSSKSQVVSVFNTIFETDESHGKCLLLAGNRFLWSLVMVKKSLGKVDSK